VRDNLPKWWWIFFVPNMIRSRSSGFKVDKRMNDEWMK